MKEAIIMIFIIFFNIFIAYIVYRKLLQVRKFTFWLISIAYLLLINFFFDLINYVHIYFRDRGTYFEFGHADILMLELFVICILMALVSIILAIIARNKSKVTN